MQEAAEEKVRFVEAEAELNEKNEERKHQVARVVQTRFDNEVIQIGVEDEGEAMGEMLFCLNNPVAQMAISKALYHNTVQHNIK